MTGVLAAFVSLGAIACDDDTDDFVNVITRPIADIVTTFHDQSFNFGALRTFAMPDTVVHFDPVTGTPIPVPRNRDAAILAQVRADFIARGYTEVSDPRTNRPDFVVLVSATATTNYNAFVGYNWFGVWGFYSGWGWYAPGFNNSWTVVYPWYATVGVTSYDRGTLLVDLIPTTSVNPLNSSITSAWTGVATGLILPDASEDRARAAVDEMFRQSPYLTATP